MSLVHTVRHRKDYKRDVTFVYTLIHLDGYRLIMIIMIIIAGQAASEFLGLVLNRERNKKTQKRKGVKKKKNRKKKGGGGSSQISAMDSQYSNV